MRRAARFFLLAAVLLAMAWGIGSIPGTLTAHSGAITVTASLPVAIVGMGLIAFGLAVLLLLLGGLRRAPGGLGSWWSGRRNGQGGQALERGIVALAAGDAAAAERQAAIARKRLGENRLALLLTAEAARLAGRTAQANAAFTALTRHPGMAFLGHRGLLRQHLASGETAAAARQAAAAEAAYPGSAWTRAQRLEIALKKPDYPAALALADNPAAVAALATAAAANAATPAEALRYARQAVRADPGLAPAIAGQAQALRRGGRARAARRVLARGWARAAHPLIADAWAEGIASPIERARAAAELTGHAPAHAESALLLAQTALAAGLSGQARLHANAAIAAGLADRRAYTVLAALDPGSAAVASAAAAPLPQWRCAACGTRIAGWTAICTVCGKAGTLVWGIAEPPPPLLAAPLAKAG